ncbi:MAG: hypothetical protein HYY81_07435, partial [Deltaproteobacteria bacterium]|nr:hypothetical protein [Deltaproteobacteria bacterium]
MAWKVEHYHENTAQCDLYDPETGRRWRSPCEPTGRNRYEKENPKQEVVSMETQTFENAGDEVHALAEKYQDSMGLSYDDALKKVSREKPQLWARYSKGESGPDHEIERGAQEFGRRITAYSGHFQISRGEAEKRVRQHDPKMKIYSNQGGVVNMDTEKIPLNAESVVATRTEEKLKAGAKDYGEAMRAVLADDPLLAECYSHNLPYVEASSARAYQEDPMASAIVRAIVEPRPGVTVEVPGMPAGDFTSTALMRLGILINGARKADNSPDVALMLQTG